MVMDNGKIIIYQVLPRLFGNSRHGVHDGDIHTNGCGKLADFTLRALQEIRALGATHIWYTGILRHATQTDYRRYGIRPDHPAIVKGKAGSPYAITDYYDVDPDLARDVPGRVREWENLIHRSHRAGLKVIMDFVPNHVARGYHSSAAPEGVVGLGETDNREHAFDAQNNFYYLPGQELRGRFDMRGGAEEAYREYPARATGNDRFDATPEVNDWYETIKLNYGVDYVGGRVAHFNPTPDTWLKMRDILLYWAGKHVDGFRCDMAEMVPVEFWEWVIPQVKAVHKGLLFIAEIYNPGAYRDYLFRGGFDYIYDKVGLYDTLRSITVGGQSATAITRCWQSLQDIQPRMLNFIENHDEQRAASDFFAGNAWKAIPALLVATTMNVNPMMIYFGQELGERGMESEGFSGRDGRTSIFDYTTVDSIRRWRNGGKYDGGLLNDKERALRRLYQRILTLSAAHPAISRGQFFDLMYVNCGNWRFDEHRQFAFLRHAEEETLLIVVNFDSTAADLHINLPQHAFDFLGLTPQLQTSATDLLSDATETISFCPTRPTEINVAGYGARIMRISE